MNTVLLNGFDNVIDDVYTCKIRTTACTKPQAQPCTSFSGLIRVFSEQI